MKKKGDRFYDFIVDTRGESVLFISGYSHNLEYFSGTTGKHYLVIGGGGGITQPCCQSINGPARTDCSKNQNQSIST